MGVGGTHEGGVQGAWNDDVVEVAALPGQQPIVLAARHGPADLACQPWCSPDHAGSLRMTRAAFNTAATMF